MASSPPTRAGHAVEQEGVGCRRACRTLGGPVPRPPEARLTQCPPPSAVSDPFRRA